MEIMDKMNEEKGYGRGVIWNFIKKWLRKKLGDKGFEDFLKNLSKEVRETLLEAKPKEWYPEEHLRRVLETSMEQIGKGDEGCIREIGAFVARESLSTFLKFLIKFASIPMVLRRMPVYWRRYTNIGEVRVKIGKGKATGSLWRHDKGRVYCPMIEGWIKESLLCAGAKEVEVREVKCRYRDKADHCEWEIKWH